jgi:hypothetical protein
VRQRIFSDMRIIRQLQSEIALFERRARAHTNIYTFIYIYIWI